MNIVPIHDVVFDDEATRLMGAAFDQACQSLQADDRAIAVRETVAKRIIEAAKTGERDEVRLRVWATAPFCIKPRTALAVGVGRKPPIPAYALVARVA
jgi:hypothetical protein